MKGLNYLCMNILGPSPLASIGPDYLRLMQVESPLWLA